MRVAFVLRLVDDFDGQTIRGKPFRFRIDGKEAHPVRKEEEGMYVFLEPMEAVSNIEVLSTDYYRCRLNVQKDQLDAKAPIADVRLYGKVGKNFPYRYSVCNGQLEDPKIRCPAQVAAVRGREIGLSLKEIKQVNGEQHLVFSGFTKEPLLGRTFALRSGNKTEVFILMEKAGMNEYRMQGILKEKHKAGTPLLRVYRSVTDAKGGYAIPIQAGEEEAIREVVVLENA